MIFSNCKTFRETNAVVVTQLPLEDTICDFWRLVYDSSSTTIVLLEDMIDMPEVSSGVLL